MRFLSGHIIVVLKLRVNWITHPNMQIAMTILYSPVTTVVESDVYE